jgi:predicted nucleic acid-binding protein
MFVGVRTPADEAKVTAALNLFGRVPTEEAWWEAAGRVQATLRSHGVTVQMTDTLIATAAIRLAVPLWTYDAYFTLMAGVLPGLALFAEPP